MDRIGPMWCNYGLSVHYGPHYGPRGLVGHSAQVGALELVSGLPRKEKRVHCEVNFGGFSYLGHFYRYNGRNGRFDGFKCVQIAPNMITIKGLNILSKNKRSASFPNSPLHPRPKIPINVPLFVGQVTN